MTREKTLSIFSLFACLSSLCLRLILPTAFFFFHCIHHVNVKRLYRTFVRVFLGPLKISASNSYSTLPFFISRKISSQIHKSRSCFNFYTMLSDCHTIWTVELMKGRGKKIVEYTARRIFEGKRSRDKVSFVTVLWKLDVGCITE